jgi:phenylalanyl-tRNA synthetase beta chain
MKIPYGWLREYCDPKLLLDEVVDALSMSGTGVERVTRVGIPSDDSNAALFRVGRVVGVKKHPGADRLRVCQVQLAGSDTRTIVCGAPNVGEEAVVLVALPGAVLPNGTKLGRVQIRGIESDGMILSEAEVGLGADANGIMELPDSLEAGEEGTRYLPLGDDVLELEVSPNRADCFAVYGVARELHAVTGAPLASDPTDEDAEATGEGTVADYLSVAVDVPEFCLRFSARVFTDVEVGPSPLWLKARLIAAGQRPINNVVDITNYVMLMLGQPMHAYDLDKLAGPSLHVRTAWEGERLTTLDGEERVFDGDAVLVCDANGPSGIGGIMGGAASEVSEETTRVAMEAATWNGPNVLTTSSKLALRTEASTRFEKQLHPELAIRSQSLAARLMVELCGASLVPGMADVAAPQEGPTSLTLRTERVERLLGERIEPAESRAYLQRLGFATEQRDGDLEVEVPYFRHYDVTREADLIEEVARVHGLDNLPLTLPARERAVGGLTHAQRTRRVVEDLLRDRGLTEAKTYSFISPSAIERLGLPERDRRRRVLHIANPLSEEQSAMRTTLLPGLLEVTRHNFAHDADGVRVFETGRVFFSNGVERLPDEHVHLGIVLAGVQQPKTWRSEAIEADFYAAKALLVAVLDGLRVDWCLADGGPSFLHAGRAAQVLAGGHEVGWLGELHPLTARGFGLDELSRTPVAVELCLDLAAEAGGRAGVYEDLITYPAVRQDIAVVVDEAVEAQTVVDIVRSAGGPELRDVRVFDLYRGEQLPEGKKSLALALEFRAADRTLTDAEVADRREDIKQALARQIDGSLRE